MHISQERHLQVLRLGPRVSGAGYQVQVRVIRYRYGCGQNSDPEPVPEPEHLNPAPDGRDPRPESIFLPLPLSLPLNSLLHRSFAPICTFAQSRVQPSFGRLPPLPTGQLVNRPASLPLSEPPSLWSTKPLIFLYPCPRAHVPTCPLN